MTLFSQLTQQFAKSKDGRVSKTELEKLQSNRGDTRFILEDLIMRADANEDKKISLEDIQRMLCGYSGK